jgi:phage-related protein
LAPGSQIEAEIHWEDDSLEVLSQFPVGVKQELGYNLRRLQKGLSPVCTVRPMQSIGRGVFELKEQDQRSWYRVIYLARIQDLIHVLHCFEKQSRKTDRRDIEIARTRLKAVRARLQEKRSEAK